MAGDLKISFYDEFNILQIEDLITPSNECQILTFEIPGQEGETVIDQDNLTVTVNVPFGTGVDSLSPTITLSDNATVSPESEVATDFTNPVPYTVTAENETDTKEYTVTVNVLPNTEALITAFDFEGLDPIVTGIIDDNAGTITLTIPYQSVTALVPTITTSDNATVSPISGVAADFTSPVVFTVTAEDGITEKEYTVTVIVEPNTEALITSFQLAGLDPVVDASIDDLLNTIEATVPNGTSLLALVPTIVASNNATLDPASGVAQNFTSPVEYTVTAEDGITEKTYTVTIEEAP